MASRELGLYNDGDYERLVRIPEDERSFQPDLARLIHSPSFRRLQHKTQLFPSIESDFFRSRLTHSLEVARIGKAISRMLNNSFKEFKDTRMKIDTDVVEFACLAHDLGHPPFGHEGENQLDELMKGEGGFEGNAQTIRIISFLEKTELMAPGDSFKHPARLLNYRETMYRPRKEKSDDPVQGADDRRCGLNVTCRALASILKYDAITPKNRPDRKRPDKGYYYRDEELISFVMKQILGTRIEEFMQRKLKEPQKVQFRTIECSIMDVADDIAYSTFDLEDCLKLGLITPLSLLSSTNDIMENVCDTINTRMRRTYPKSVDEIRPNTIRRILRSMFSDLLPLVSSGKKGARRAMGPGRLDKGARAFNEDGYFRTKFTAALVRNAIEGIEIDGTMANVHPALYQVRLKKAVVEKVEILKNLVFEIVTKSPRMRVVSYRGRHIVGELFRHLTSEGSALLPPDQKALYEAFNKQDLISREMADLIKHMENVKNSQRRVICDFISGMTDRFAVEMYGRLTSTDPVAMMKATS